MRSGYRGVIRSIDVFGRYGGEEFLLILPDTNDQALYAAAERVRTAVEQLVFNVDEQTFSVTLSAGIANGRAGEPYRALLKRADSALYAAKHGGRNRVSWGHAAATGAADELRHYGGNAAR